MSKGKHGEPWIYDRNFGVCVKGEPYVLLEPPEHCGVVEDRRDKAAQRAVTCVNALEDYNPEAVRDVLRLAISEPGKSTWMRAALAKLEES